MQMFFYFFPICHFIFFNLLFVIKLHRFTLSALIFLVLVSILTLRSQPKEDILWGNQGNAYYSFLPIPGQTAKSLGSRGVERPLERAVLGVGLPIRARQSASVGAGEKRRRILVSVMPRTTTLLELGTSQRTNSSKILRTNAVPRVHV